MSVSVLHVTSDSERELIITRKLCVCFTRWLPSCDALVAASLSIKAAMGCAKGMMAKVPCVGFKPESGLLEQTPEVYVLVVACLLLPVLLLKLNSRPKYKLPPSPRAYPITGHLHLLGKLPHQSMANMAKQYGEIYSLRLGSVPAIVVTTPEMAREFLQVQDKCWASRTTRISSAFYFSYNYTGDTLLNLNLQGKKICCFFPFVFLHCSLIITFFSPLLTHAQNQHQARVSTVIM